MLRIAPVCFLAFFFSTPAMAWSDHSRATAIALGAMPEVASAAPVTAETLDDFLRAEEPKIAALFSENETWGTAHFENYPKLPAALVFTAIPDRDDAARRLAFLHALRVAADYPFALEGAAGDMIAPLTLISAAAAEPDNGLDFNCWDNSPGAWGKTYGFGPMPFGNPALSFATQAPFHMGIYHENPVFPIVAPSLKRTYPALRYHEFATLAALAFRTGHQYWGWRFAGMALHYIQDGTQPYHARIFPADSFVKVFAAHALLMAGFPAREHDMTVLVSNRHLVLEDYTTQVLDNEQGAPIREALARTGDDAKYPPWSDRALEDVITAESAAVADRTAALVIAAMPAHLVSDPSYDVGGSNDHIDMVAAASAAPPAARTALLQQIVDLHAHFGAHTRRAVRAILAEAHSG